uniref:Uncharacterized protein n=1 Tax=Nelumbo nucifera TaxID=4432 RepID=A0A822XQF8_NELNU|nr:TPA_asm: hypothetical protein HUJ06_025307 [Nelumbo nucifera]
MTTEDNHLVLPGRGPNPVAVVVVVIRSMEHELMGEGGGLAANSERLLPREPPLRVRPVFF